MCGGGKQEVSVDKQPTLAAPSPSTATLSDLLNPFISQTTINVGVLERLASLAVGATVLLLIVRRFLLYGGLLVAGGYLLYRGLTGYCPLYASEQIDTRHWRLKLPARSTIRQVLDQVPRWALWQQHFAGNEQRSKLYEQDNSTRQMAPYAWQPEDGVGALD